MNLFITLIKACLIVLVAYILFFGIMWTLMFLRYRTVWTNDLGIAYLLYSLGFHDVDRLKISLLGPVLRWFALLSLTTFGAFYLPRNGRIGVAITAMILFLCFLAWHAKALIFFWPNTM